MPRPRLALITCGAALALLGAMACGPAATPTPTPTPTPPVATPTPTPAGVAPTPTVEAGAKRGGTIRTSHRRTPSEFDLMDTTTIDNIGTVTPAYNQLWMVSPPDYTQIIGDLVTDWSFSNGGRTLTVTIASGVKDHAGNPFTADDVKWSLERASSTELNLLNSPLLANVFESIEAPNDTTVVMNLTTPQASLITKLSTQYFPMYTREAWEGVEKFETAVGTGPWKLKEHSSGQRVVYERNTDYFKEGLPYADELIIIAIQDGSTRLAAFETRQLDLILLGSSHGIFEENLRDVESRQGDKITWFTGVHFANRGILFNVKQPPFDDARVRRAVHLAVSRQNAATSMPLSKIYGIYVVPSNVWGYTIAEAKEMPGYREDKEADIAQAKQLMADAGYANGFTVNALCRDTADYRDLHCPFIAFELQKLGIQSTLDVKESATWQQARETHQFVVDYGNIGSAPADDPSFFLADFVCGAPTNYGQYCNPEYDALMQQQDVTVDPVARNALIKQMQDILLEDVPVVDVWWAARAAVYWNYVKNAPREEFSGQYSQARRLEYVWLDR